MSRNKPSRSGGLRRDGGSPPPLLGRENWACLTGDGGGLTRKGGNSSMIQAKQELPRARQQDWASEQHNQYFVDFLAGQRQENDIGRLFEMGYTRASAADRIYQEQQAYANMHKKNHQQQHNPTHSPRHWRQEQVSHHRSSPNLSGLPAVKPFFSGSGHERSLAAPSFSKRYPEESRFGQKLVSIQKRHGEELASAAETMRVKSRSVHELHSNEFPLQQFRDDGSIIEVKHVKAKRPIPTPQNERYLTSYGSSSSPSLNERRQQPPAKQQREQQHSATSTQHTRQKAVGAPLPPPIDCEPDSLNDSYLPKLEAYKAKVRAAKQALIQETSTTSRSPGRFDSQQVQPLAVAVAAAANKQMTDQYSQTQPSLEENVDFFPRYNHNIRNNSNNNHFTRAEQHFLEKNGVGTELDSYEPEVDFNMNQIISMDDYESLTPSQFQEQINNHGGKFRPGNKPGETATTPAVRVNHGKQVLHQLIMFPQRGGKQKERLLGVEAQLKLVQFRRFIKAAGINRRRFVRKVKRQRRLQQNQTYDEDGVRGGRSILRHGRR